MTQEHNNSNDVLFGFIAAAILILGCSLLGVGLSFYYMANPTSSSVFYSLVGVAGGSLLSLVGCGIKAGLDRCEQEQTIARQESNIRKQLADNEAQKAELDKEIQDTRTLVQSVLADTAALNAEIQRDILIAEGGSLPSQTLFAPPAPGANVGRTLIDVQGSSNEDTVAALNTALATGMEMVNERDGLLARLDEARKTDENSRTMTLS